MIAEADFRRARELVLSEGDDGTGGIGTLSEKTLHRILKNAIEPDPACREVPFAGYVADILTPSGITEIQTRSLERLVPKLNAFLPHAPVRVIYPIVRKKRLRWIDPRSGEISEARKSPKTGTCYDAAREVYKIRSFLGTEGFSLTLLLFDAEEFRYLDGWDKTGKHGSTRAERIPTALADEITFHAPEDYRVLLPDIPSPFTTKEFALAIRQKPRWAYLWIRMLLSLGLLVQTGKRGREYIYETVKEEKL